MSASQVLLTLFGPVADLDRLGSAPIVVGVNVAGLAPGSHELPVVPSLPSTLTLVEVSPETVIVTIAVPATQAPAASGDVQSPAAPDGGADVAGTLTRTHRPITRGPR